MTTEQREAIDRLSHLLAKGKYGIAGKTLLYEDYYMLKNVLEVVENQEQKIIKQQEEIENKDEIIDLYIEELICNEFDRCCQECCRECEKDKDTIKYCIKQYFERKAENEK